MNYITNAVYINDRERVLCKEDGRTKYTAAELTEIVLDLQLKHLKEEIGRENAEKKIASIKQVLQS